MEAVGASASVLTFIVFGLQCTKTIFNTLDAAKDGPPAIERLAQSISNLEKLLLQLQQSRATGTDPTLASHIQRCVDELKPMAEGIEKLQLRPDQLRSGRLWRRIKIFIKEDSLDKMVQHINAHCNALNLRLSAVTSELVYRSHKSTLQMEPKIDSILNGMQTQEQIQTAFVSGLKNSVMPALQSQDEFMAKEFSSLQDAIAENKSSLESSIESRMESFLQEIKYQFKSLAAQSATNMVQSDVDTSAQSSSTLNGSSDVAEIASIIEKFYDLYHKEQQCIDTHSDSNEKAETIMHNLRAILGAVSKQSMIGKKLQGRFCSYDCRKTYIQDSGLDRFERSFGQIELHINKPALEYQLSKTPIRQKRTRCEFDIGIGTLGFTMNKRMRKSNISALENYTDYAMTLSFLPSEPRKHFMVVASTVQQQLARRSISSLSRLTVNRVVPNESKIFQVVKEGRVEELREMLCKRDDGASLRDHDEHGASLLFYATRQPEMCKFLLESGLDVDHVGEARFTGLGLVSVLEIEGNDFEMEKDTLQKINQCRTLFLDAGADPTLSADPNGKSFVLEASKDGIQETLSVIKQSETFWLFTSKTDIPRLPTYFCDDLNNGYNKGTFTWLLESGIDIHDVNFNGGTCLHACLANTEYIRPNQHHDALVCLLNSKVDLHKIDRAGRTASDIAYSHNFSYDYLFCSPCIEEDEEDEDTEDSEDDHICACGHHQYRFTMNEARRLGSYIGDLWDSVLHRCGYDIKQMRGDYQRKASYTDGFRAVGYSRKDFEELWKGRENECPYWDEYWDTEPWRPWDLENDSEGG